MRTREIPHEMILRLHHENCRKQLSMARTLANARDKSDYTRLSWDKCCVSGGRRNERARKKQRNTVWSARIRRILIDRRDLIRYLFMTTTVIYSIRYLFDAHWFRHVNVFLLLNRAQSRNIPNMRIYSPVLYMLQMPSRSRCCRNHVWTNES